MSCVLASKFWEDVSVWNIDFVDHLKIYSLNTTKKLESIFLGICKYQLFVTAEQYTAYFFTLVDRQREFFLRTIEAHEDEDLRRALLNYVSSKNRKA